jgi:hypothetical protein
MITQKDRQRIIELISQGRAAGDPVEDIARRITEQMPHVTVDDIAHIAAVHAEELDLDAGVHAARVDALRQIKAIVEETERGFGEQRLTVEDAYVLLTICAQRSGDKRARELLSELDKAALVVGLGD